MTDRTVEARRSAADGGVRVAFIPIALAACCLLGSAAAAEQPAPSGGGLALEGVQLGLAVGEAIRILEGRGFRLSHSDRWFLERGDVKSPMRLELDSLNYVEIELAKSHSAPVMERPVQQVKAVYPPADDVYRSYVRRYGNPSECGGAGPNEQGRPFDCSWLKRSGPAEILHVAFGAGRKRMALATLMHDKPAQSESRSRPSGAQSADGAKQTGNFAIEGVHGRMRVGEAKARLRSLGYKVHNFHPCLFERAADGRETVVTLRSEGTDCKDDGAMLTGVDAKSKNSRELDPMQEIESYDKRLGRHSHCTALQRDRASCVWPTPASALDVELFTVRIARAGSEIAESLSFMPARSRAEAKPASTPGQAKHPSYSIEGVRLGMSGEQARANLEAAGFTFFRKGGCGFERRTEKSEISLSLNDGDCAPRPVAKISMTNAEKGRRAKPTEADMRAIVEAFKGKLGAPELCKLHAVLTNCRWSGPPELEGAALALQIAPWPGVFLRTTQTVSLAAGGPAK